MTDTTTTLGSGGAAPDWGKDYGIDALWHEIVPGLWLGGTGDDDDVSMPRALASKGYGIQLADAEITKDQFDAVVTMYAWAQPVDWHVEELRLGIMDSKLDAAQVDMIVDAAIWAHKRWKAGKKTLIRCQAGLNRSSLVLGLVLMLEGWSGRDAIKAIREGRTYECLNNRYFVNFLTTGPAELAIERADRR